MVAQESRQVSRYALAPVSFSLHARLLPDTRVLTGPAKSHARKVAKELGVKSGIIYLLGQEEKLYEDSDMGPEFRQRR